MPEGVQTRISAGPSVNANTGAWMLRRIMITMVTLAIFSGLILG
jgi:hypothetical protein